MSNYTKTTDFEAKDSLPTGDSGKIIRGAEFETEFDAISTAIATKADTAGPTFTGTLTFETISDGTIGVTAFVDEDNMASNSATLVPTQQSVKAYVDSVTTELNAQDLDFQADSGGALNIDLDTETMTFTGGTGIDTTGSGNTVTFDIDSTVTTLTGTQTLTNKTLTAPVISGNLTTDGTIDGRDVATDGAKLDGIEASATADQTDAEIRAAVEAATDSNVFTDADHTKLDGIEASATADQTDAEIRAAVEAATDSNVFTDADHTKLDGIEANATADQTDAEIRAAVEAATDSNVFTDADHTKLDGIEALADVTDTTNVTAAGALMDSELTDITAVKSLNQGVATTDTPTFAGLTTTADVSFGDNDKAIFGAGSDLQIYHDGSNSFIADVGTGNLGIRAENLFLQNADGSANYATASLNGAFTLSYNNSIKLATIATGIDVTGTVVADGLTVANTAVIAGDFDGGTAATYIRLQDDTDNFLFGSNNSLGNFLIKNETADALRLSVANTGDISFYEDTGTTAKLFWDASAESLGIGTSSLIAKMHVKGAGTSSSTNAIFAENSSGAGLFAIRDNGDAFILGNTGIGTSSPSGKLSISGATATNELVHATFTNTSGAKTFAIGAGQSGVTNNGFVIRNVTDNTFPLVISDAGVTSFGAGNVGIGTSSPEFPITAYGSSNQVYIGSVTPSVKTVLASDETNLRAYIGTRTNHPISFVTDGDERMRISGGNLLVGTTSSTAGITATSGNSFVYRPAAELTVARQGSGTTSPVAIFNQTGDDGQILDFRKDGTTVGSIGTAGGDLTINGQGGIGVLQAGGTGQFAWASNLFYPITDNAKDLGTSSFRFKDLYLSGGVQFGTTGAAAQNLDDYEEGSYVATLTPSTSGSITLNGSYDRLAYTKVGRMVSIVGRLRVSSVSSPVGTYVRVSLPFNIATGIEDDSRLTGSVVVQQAAQDIDKYCIHPKNGTSYIEIGRTDNFASNAANDFSGNELVAVNFTYIAA